MAGATHMHVGDIELRYVPEAEPIAPSDGAWLPYLGSGEGSVAGGGLRGRVRFSSFEDDATGRSCLVSGVGACVLNVAAIIETDDGARVRLEALGYAVRDNGTRWRTALGVRAASDDLRYAWLAASSLTWLGEFDEHAGIARAALYRGPAADPKTRD